MCALFVINAGAGRPGCSSAAAHSTRMALSKRRAQVVLPRRATDPIDEQLHDGLTRSPGVIVAVGGDGTANAAAAEAVRLDVPLLIVPAGATNLVARDAGLYAPGAMRHEHGLELIERRVDVASVNGKPFLHSSLLGLVPAIAQRREHLRRKRGISDRTRELCRLAHTAFTARQLRVRMTTDGAEHEGYAASIVVSCNPLSIRPRLRFQRPALDGGRLCVYSSTHRDGLPRLQLLAAHLSGSVARDPRFRMTVTRALSIRLPLSPVSATNDGDIVRLWSPLEYSVAPRALRLLVPVHRPPQ